MNFYAHLEEITSSDNYQRGHLFAAYVDYCKKYN